MTPSAYTAASSRSDKSPSHKCALSGRAGADFNNRRPREPASPRNRRSERRESRAHPRPNSNKLLCRLGQCIASANNDCYGRHLFCELPIAPPYPTAAGRSSEIGRVAGVRSPAPPPRCDSCLTHPQRV